MNLLLDALDAADRAAVDVAATRRPLVAGERVVRAGDTFDTILFPTAGAIVLHPAGDNPLAIGVIGREGLLGWSLLLGDRLAPLDAVVTQSGGSARALDSDAFVELCERLPTLRSLALRFAQSIADQLADAAVAAIAARAMAWLSRWLLMLHDRQDGDELLMTHETLATQLGLRRATVTDCLHRLEGGHVLRCDRRRIVIRDRAALEEAAGNAYGNAERCYRRLIGPMARPA